MTYDNIGAVIRFFRRQKGLPQELLARNICSREQLIRIEKGTSIPSFFTLKLLSSKLGVDFSKYFEFLEYQSPIEAFQYFETFQKLHNTRKYNELLICLNEFKSKYNSFKYHELSLCWYECMCNAHINKDFKGNFNILSKALLNSYDFNGPLLSFLDTHITPIDFRIINTLAIFQICSNNLESGYEILNKCSNKLLEKYSEIDSNIIIPILLNYCKMLYNKELYTECIEICDKTIDLSIRKVSLLLIGDLYVIKGNSLEKLNNYELAKKSFGYYIYYYEMTNQSALVKKNKESLNLQYDNIYF